MANKNSLIRSKKKKARELVQAGKYGEAKVILEQICKVGQRDPDNWLLLGVVCSKQGLNADAVKYFRQADIIKPDNAQIKYNLGVALRDSGNYEEALVAFQDVLKNNSDIFNAGIDLAQTYFIMGRLDESETAYRACLKQQPNNAVLHSNLGAVLQAKGLNEEAIACYRKAIRLRPDLPVYDALGSSLVSQGKFEDALLVYREGLNRQPNNVRVYSNLLLTLNYMSDADPREVYRQHQGWGRIHGRPAGQVKKHANIRDPEKRLRIGYVSPDFRNHSVAYYIEPLLAAHHREAVEIFCYSVMPQPDATTRRLKSLSDHWHGTHGWSDKQLVETIVSDDIDILVDLAGHTAYHNLTAFAFKPAPIQVSYLGYPNTTGLQTMDYRLTDNIADPAGEDAFYVEDLVRLPGCFLCYQPLADAPTVASLPAKNNGFVTFGSFNNLAKINPLVIALWAQVLEAVPGSRLLIKNRSLTDPGTRESYYRLFAKQGVRGERLELIGHIDSRQEHLDLYGRMDIALDTFPYNGTATTCEALWMGVPVVTLQGDRHAGRVGTSILGAIDLGQWAASSQEQFIAVCTDLAADPDGLTMIRKQLRQRLASSPLCDSERFATNIEQAYRTMWVAWCETGS